MDHTHEKLVDTSIDGNPTEGTFDNLRLRFVFRRKSSNDQRRDRAAISDGNPLVYALKKMNGFTIMPMYLNMLYRRADEIVDGMKPDLAADWLVDVPSSKPLCRTFMLRCAQILEISPIPPGFLRKRTVAEVLSDFDQGLPDFQHRRDERLLKNELGVLRKVKQDEVFQMKHVTEIKARPYFQPFTPEGDIAALAGQTILLIDDLAATGTSVSSVAQCLRSHGVIVREGVTLLSTLDARHPRDDH